MFNSKKNYVSPEVNVILVDQDVITISGLEPLPDGEGGVTPEVPVL